MNLCCSRIGENLEHLLPSLKELILTSNNIQELVSHTRLGVRAKTPNTMFYWFISLVLCSVALQMSLLV